MQFKDFLYAIPSLCGAKNAERVGRKNVLVFDYELGNDSSEFKRSELDEKDPGNRLSIMFDFSGDEKKIEHCKKIVRIAELSHYKAEHEITIGELEELDSLVVSAVDSEQDNQEIASVFSVDQAVAMSGWNG